jgi:hypothetical protein
VRLRKLRRLSEISLDVWLFLAKLVLFTLAARVTVKSVALTRPVGFMARCAGNRGLGRFRVNHGCHEAAPLAFLAGLIAWLTPGHGRCLLRSLLLFRLLKAQREPNAAVIHCDPACIRVR